MNRIVYKRLSGLAVERQFIWSVSLNGENQEGVGWTLAANGS